jgi:hypothetical protein
MTTKLNRFNTPSFGGKLLRLHIGPRNRYFSAHEDLLCARSTYFKNRFQKIRKVVEGDCAICHEALNALTETITYCKTCGNNLHQDCMKQWVDKTNNCPNVPSGLDQDNTSQGRETR